MKPFFAHIKSTKDYFNQGDANCCPQSYFPDYADCDVVSLDDVAKFPKGQPVILGGGGLFGVVPDDWLQRTIADRPVIVWGAGLNYGTPPHPGLAPLLHQCALVGLRDSYYARQNGFAWAPCASALHPAFHDFDDVTTHPAVVYRHAWSHPFLTDLPTKTNMNRNDHFQDTLAFLASGETVVTNSYHGAYWSMLLGRRVILWNPIGIRFFSGLPSIPPIAHNEAELEMLLQVAPYPKKRPDCITATLRFKRRVDDLLQ